MRGSPMSEATSKGTVDFPTHYDEMNRNPRACLPVRTCGQRVCGIAVAWRPTSRRQPLRVIDALIAMSATLHRHRLPDEYTGPRFQTAGSSTASSSSTSPTAPPRGRLRARAGSSVRNGRERSRHRYPVPVTRRADLESAALVKRRSSRHQRLRDDPTRIACHFLGSSAASPPGSCSTPLHRQGVVSAQTVRGRRPARFSEP